MFKLKITNITTQRDLKALVKYLLELPGLDSDRVSRGLKVLPFEILSVEQETQAREIQATIEKFGALCTVEDTNAPTQRLTPLNIPIPVRRRKKSYNGIYLGVGSIIVTAIILGLSFDYFASQEKYNPQKASQKAAQAPRPVPERPPVEQEKPTETEAEKPQAEQPRNSEDLKKELSKNPYNPDTWKTLSENLEQMGDTVAARKAKESYEKAIRTQRALSSMAKSFGNSIRVEITEDAVYYRTSRDFKTEDEFYFEASKLRDSLSAKFKGRKLIIENYTSNNSVQRVELEP
jgi:hypothetical protein